VVKLTTGSGGSETTVADYRYDGLNRRVEKKLADDTKTEYFYNENWQTLEEQHLDADNTLVSTDQYIWDLSYIDTPVVSFHIEGSTTTATYYTTDANHNVTAAVNANGTVAHYYGYSPYGVATVYDDAWSNGAATTSDGFLYAGYQFDHETGLYLPRNRLYHPTLGVFPARDPMGYAGGDENLYRYVTNAPTSCVDATGLWHRDELTDGRYWRSDNDLDTFKELAGFVLKEIGLPQLDPEKYQGAILPDPTFTWNRLVTVEHNNRWSPADVDEKTKSQCNKRKPWKCGFYDVTWIAKHAKNTAPLGNPVDLVLGDPRFGTK
jgi:RHS repeat-associated protein